MKGFIKRTSLSDKKVALIHGGNNLRYVVLSNNDKPITSKQWTDLMVLLESKGYLWKGGYVPTFGKVPPPVERNLWVNNKTISFAQAHYTMKDYFIKLDEFKSIIEAE